MKRDKDDCCVCSMASSSSDAAGWIIGLIVLIIIIIIIAAICCGCGGGCGRYGGYYRGRNGRRGGGRGRRSGSDSDNGGRRRSGRCSRCGCKKSKCKCKPKCKIMPACDSGITIRNDTLNTPVLDTVTVVAAGVFVPGLIPTASGATFNPSTTLITSLGTLVTSVVTAPTPAIFSSAPLTCCSSGCKSIRPSTVTTAGSTSLGLFNGITVTEGAPTYVVVSVSARALFAQAYVYSDTDTGVIVGQVVFTPCSSVSPSVVVAGLNPVETYPSVDLDQDFQFILAPTIYQVCTPGTFSIYLARSFTTTPTATTDYAILTQESIFTVQKLPQLPWCKCPTTVCTTTVVTFCTVCQCNKPCQCDC